MKVWHLVSVPYRTNNDRKIWYRYGTDVIISRDNHNMMVAVVSGDKSKLIKTSYNKILTHRLVNVTSIDLLREGYSSFDLPTSSLLFFKKHVENWTFAELVSDDVLLLVWVGVGCSGARQSHLLLRRPLPSTL